MYSTQSDVAVLLPIFMLGFFGNLSTIMNRLLIASSLYLIAPLWSLSIITDSAHAQATKPSQREILAKQIKQKSYEFANDPSNYKLVQEVEAEVWKMIRISEGLSSCAVPSYDLAQRLEGFNATYIQMKSLLDSLPGNIPAQIKQQSVGPLEAGLNGQKAAIAKVLQNVEANCK